jgi:hypothetical protein
MSCTEVRHLLEHYGVLLLQDKKLPSVVGTFTGEALSSSWWNHPRAHDIYQCLEQLDVHGLPTRLIAGKVTYVHKRLWPVLAAVGGSNEKWQTDGLSTEARRLLRAAQQGTVAAKGRAAKELQQRLLVVAQEVHTEKGRHEMRLETWPSWAERVGVRPHRSAEKAARTLESAARALGAALSSLPWGG